MAWSEFSVRLPGYTRETAGHRQDALRYSLQEGGRSWWGGRGLGFGVRGSGALSLEFSETAPSPSETQHYFSSLDLQ